MDYKSIAERILALRDADLALRDVLVRNGQLAEGYNKEMEQLHNENAEILTKIIDTMGYPTIDKVGQEANEAAWLVIQHAIGRPGFMKRCRELLENVVSEDNVIRRQLAYLTDRIAVLEGKPQLYGTQFDWDENGEVSPNRFDDLTNVNQRRKSIGLNPLEDQTVLIRTRAENEKQSPPKDLEKRRQQLDEWRRAVGWIQ